MAGIVALVSLLVVLQSVLAVNTTDLPDDLLIGFATASYQIEGAWNESGKGENIWDRLCHDRNELIADRSSGDIADDSYHKWETDLDILKEQEAQIYRFSLSWSRILPDGTLNTINEAGIDYYNKVIDGLLDNDIEPMVTIYHWDLPQPLQDIGGWPNRTLVNYYVDFANLCFSTFGDRVKKWITFNEALEITANGYGDLVQAPALNQSGTLDYQAAHTLLLAHAAAYHLYYDEYQPSQQGVVGITLNGGWMEPKNTSSTADIEAANRANQFEIGWFANPVYNGDYPSIMRNLIDRNSQEEGLSQSRLPVFTSEQVDYIRGTSDFYGLNHYSTYLAEPGNGNAGATPSYYKDKDILISFDPTWPMGASSWLSVVPWGLRNHLNFIKNTYNNPIIYITENGFSDRGELEDDDRVSYYHDYIAEVLKAIYEDDVQVKAYTAWSLLDNFEWRQGYTERFGIYNVNYSDVNRTRTPKKSAKFFQELIKTRKLPELKHGKYYV